VISGQKPRALVLTGYGLNCDYETASALELAGAKVSPVHVNLLVGGQVKLDDFHLLALIGGFSYADDHGAGVVLANRLATGLGEAITKFIADEKLIIGICNGFQVMVNLGLLPGFDNDYRSRRVALIANDCGNFQDRWVKLAVEPAARCVFTAGLETIDLPIRHGEGKFFAPDDVLGRIEDQAQVAVRYADAEGRPAKGDWPANPNGSLHDIAGISDPTGRVFGLMPHPEAHLHWTNHPDWTRHKEALSRAGQPLPEGPGPGVRIFENGIKFLRDKFN
jgi:phosphoribosylformylglycinamidine synthase